MNPRDESLAGRWARRVLAFVLTVALGAVGCPGSAGESPPERTPLAALMTKLNYARIPLRLDEDEHLLAAGELGGRQTAFLVDTGFSVTSIHIRQGERLPRIEPGKLKVRDGVLGEVQGKEWVLIEKFTLARSEFLNHPARLEDLSLLQRNSGSRRRPPAQISARAAGLRGVDVVLGGDFLHRHYAVLDPYGLSLYVAAAAPSEQTSAVLSGSLTRSGWSEVLAQKADETTLTVTAGVNGKPVRLLVDSGAFVTLLDKAVARRLRLPIDRSIFGVAGIDGPASDLFVADVSFRLGNWEDRRFALGVTVFEPHGWAGGGNPTNRFDGFLGRDLLFGARAVVDYHTRRLYLRAGEHGKRPVPF